MLEDCAGELITKM